MKIINDPNNLNYVTLELETIDGQNTFKVGREDHRHWQRSPETIELSNFVNNNHKFSQIVIKSGDTYARIK